MTVMITLTPEQIAEIIDLAVEGKPIAHIINYLEITASQFWYYKKHNPRFLENFDLARQEGLEHLADSLINIADEYEDVFKARLKSDNLKWLLAKRKPHTYGEKIELNINKTIDISGALEDARKRALLPICYPQPIDYVEAIDITHDSQEPATGEMPVSSMNPNAKEISEIDLTDEVDIFS